MKLRVGDRVMLDHDSRFAVMTDSSNPLGVVGVVTSTSYDRHNGLPLRVDWANGEFNSYDHEDLVRIERSVPNGSSFATWIKNLECT